MLKISHAYKTFNKGEATENKVFEDLNLNVEAGEFITIIGSNGAGKSTLFNLIGGDCYVDQGNITLDGKDITWEPLFKRAIDIGRLYQDPMRGTAPHMTIEENLSLALGSGKWITKINNKDREYFREKLRALDMGLEDRLKDEVGLLSGGQRQALTLLMAVINPPKLLLLDEHTAALDPKTAEKVLHITKQVAYEHNLTVLMITHDMNTALELGTRTLMMKSGKIIYDVAGEERKKLAVSDLLAKFKENTGEELANDRILLS